jgi:hypothetical protein
MTNILDTVDIRALARQAGFYASEDTGDIYFCHRGQQLCVTKLLEGFAEAHRKQVLLAAAVICEARGSLLPDLSDGSLTAFDLCAEFRLMAEGEKHE